MNLWFVVCKLATKPQLTDLNPNKVQTNNNKKFIENDIKKTIKEKIPKNKEGKLF